MRSPLTSVPTSRMPRTAPQAVRNEVTELSDTAVLLGLAVEPVQPTPELKTNLMAMLDSTPQLAPESTQAAAQHVAPARPSAAQFDRPAQAKARARWFTRPVAVLTAAAAAVVLIVGGVVVTNQFATSDLPAGARSTGSPRSRRRMTRAPDRGGRRRRHRHPGLVERTRQLRAHGGRHRRPARQQDLPALVHRRERRPLLPARSTSATPARPGACSTARWAPATRSASPSSRAGGMRQAVDQAGRRNRRRPESRAAQPNLPET